MGTSSNYQNQKAMRKLFTLLSLVFLFSLFMPVSAIAQDEDMIPAAIKSGSTLTFTYISDTLEFAINNNDGPHFIPGIAYNLDKIKGFAVGDGIHDDIGGGYDQSAITSIVFDNSFSKAIPNNRIREWFRNMTNLRSISGIGNINTSNVTDMSFLFGDCSSLTSLNLSGLATSNVTEMSYMFSGCSNLTSLNISNFNTSKVTEMSGMFNGCSKLSHLNVSSFNTSNVKSMSSMFSHCSNLVSLDLSGFNTSNVTNMWSMFNGCSSLKDLNISNFNTENVTDMSYMFDNCSSLTSLDLSGISTEKVTSWNSMFSGCTGLVSLDARNFSARNTHSFSYMFYGCSNLKTLNLSNINTDNVTSMNGMFSGCSSLENIDLSHFNTTDVTDMSWMFNSCSSLKNIDIAKFNTAKVINMSYMFSDCSSLTSLDVSNFNTSNVTNMASMFSGCSNLTYLDVSRFNTSNVTDMSYMFDSCSSLKNIDVSRFNTSNVTDMDMMFSSCSGLASIDLSSFNTLKINRAELFYDTNLTEICVGDKNYNNANYFFSGVGSRDTGCNLLVSKGFDTSVLGEKIKDLYNWLGGYFNIPKYGEKLPTFKKYKVPQDFGYCGGSIAFSDYTFKNDVDVSTVEDLQVYIVKVDASSQSLIAQQVTSIPAGTPTIIVGKQDQYTIYASETTPQPITGNDLIVSSAKLTSDGTQWIPTSRSISATTAKTRATDTPQPDRIVGFERVESGTVIPEGTIYLTIANVSADTDFIPLRSSESTGIRNIDKPDPNSTESSIYNFSGQRVSESYKGVVIKGGKKYVNK